jgi:hypothetical protein
MDGGHLRTECQGEYLGEREESKRGIREEERYNENLSVLMSTAELAYSLWRLGYGLDR